MAPTGPSVPRSPASSLPDLRRLRAGSLRNGHQESQINPAIGPSPFFRFIRFDPSLLTIPTHPNQGFVMVIAGNSKVGLHDQFIEGRDRSRSRKVPVAPEPRAAPHRHIVGVAFDQECFDSAVSVRIAGDLSRHRHFGMAGNNRLECRGKGSYALLSPRVELSASAVKKNILGQPQDACAWEHLNLDASRAEAALDAPQNVLERLLIVGQPLDRAVPLHLQPTALEFLLLTPGLRLTEVYCNPDSPDQLSCW
jgi:hypothetical protein